MTQAQVMMMTLIPEFELGLWNAWMLMSYILLLNILPNVALSKEAVKKLGSDTPLSEKEKMASNAVSFTVFALIAYSFFLPLKLGTPWFAAGLVVFL